MATANFHARIERIQKAQQQMAQPASKPVREGGVASVAAVMQPKKRRSAFKDNMLSLVIGIMLGGLAAVMFIGLSMESSPWGPETDLNDAVQYVTLASFGMAPVLMLIAVIVASKRPGFALFSLGYISALVTPLLT